MINDRAKRAIWGAVLDACRTSGTHYPTDMAKSLIKTYEFIFSENTPVSHQDTLKSKKPKDTSDTEHRSQPPLEH